MAPKATAPSNRSDARRIALLAIHEWLVGCLTDAAALRDASDHKDQRDVLIILRAVSNENELPDDAEDDDIKEALVSVDLVSAVGVSTLNSETYEQSWAKLVSLWTDVREACSYAAMCPTPASMILDLDAQAIATYDTTYCPAIGPMIDVWASVKRPPLGTGDPFEELLLSLNDDEDDMESRIDNLLEKYGIEAPSVPHNCEDENVPRDS